MHKIYPDFRLENICILKYVNKTKLRVLIFVVVFSLVHHCPVTFSSSREYRGADISTATELLNMWIDIKLVVLTFTQGKEVDYTSISVTNIRLPPVLERTNKVLELSILYHKYTHMFIVDFDIIYKGVYLTLRSNSYSGFVREKR